MSYHGFQRRNLTVKLVNKDKKYSPKKILQNFKEIRASNKKFNEFVPVITNEKIHQISKELNMDYEKVYNIYSLFSFCNEVTDLPSNDFYKLLLEIPNIKDFTKKIRRRIFLFE